MASIRDAGGNMIVRREFILFQGTRDNNVTTIFVHIFENGSLSIKRICVPLGWGKYVDEMTAEFYYNFDEANTMRLIELLPAKESNIEALLRENFNDFDGCDKLEEFCKKEKIVWTNSRETWNGINNNVI